MFCWCNGDFEQGFELVGIDIVDVVSVFFFFGVGWDYGIQFVVGEIGLYIYEMYGFGLVGYEVVW